MRIIAAAGAFVHCENLSVIMLKYAVCNKTCNNVNIKGRRRTRAYEVKHEKFTSRNRVTVLTYRKENMTNTK